MLLDPRSDPCHEVRRQPDWPVRGTTVCDSLVSEALSVGLLAVLLAHDAR
jgi:hypothetical protein